MVSDGYGVYDASLLDMITAGYLANLPTRQGDVVDGALDTLLFQADAPQHVVQAYQTHAAGRKALVLEAGLWGGPPGRGS